MITQIIYQVMTKALQWFCVIALLATAVVGDVSNAQLEALNNFFDSTDGPHWTNKMHWTFGDPCTYSINGVTGWYGVTCNDDNTEVISLDLHNNNVEGEFPPTFVFLTSLTVL